MTENQLGEIQELAKNLMLNRKSHNQREMGSVYYHGERVAKLCIELRKLLLPNDGSHDEALIIASWYHDISKGIEPHAQYGSVIAREALKSLLPAEELDRICELIATHCFRNPASNTYSETQKIFQDADMIDHFGVNGIWILIQHFAHTEGAIQDLILHYKDKHDVLLEKNRRLLNFELSRKIFDERADFEIRYFERLECEGVGGIFNLRRILGE